MKIRSGPEKGWDYPLIVILLIPAVLFAFTVNRYYGYYYDNKFFNLLALEVWEKFRVVIYLGSHYHVPSALYSYICYLFFYVFGPGDLAMEAPAAIFHLLAVWLCYRLGVMVRGRDLGLVFALLVALAPIHLVQVYTLPDLSFAVFLHVWSLYLFLRGLERRSILKVLAASFIYSLACFQAIYYLMLLPFYIVYPLFFHKWGDKGNQKAGVLFWILTAVLLLAVMPSYYYIYLVLRATVMQGWGAAWLWGIAPASLVLLILLTLVLKFRKMDAKSAVIALCFSVVAVALLGLYDLFVQIDYHWFDHRYGYFRDATLAGGYGGRPPLIYLGKEVRLGEMKMYMSVLTSMFTFAGTEMARPSLDSSALRSLYAAYFLKSFPPLVRFFFYAGVVSALIESARGLRKKASGLSMAFPLILLIVSASPFVSLGPDYYNIRRIYILPVPYIFAAFGVIACASLAARAAASASFDGVKLKASAMVLTAVLVTADQARFSSVNIFQKYTLDSSTSMFYKLFYGHFYGRAYREAGELLLKEVPPKKDGRYRAGLVYTIPEDTPIGRAMPLLNTMEWYARDNLWTVYNFKGTSREYYGTPENLTSYIARLFRENPVMEVLYFADFIDPVDRNYSFFSKLYPGLKPYKIADEDGRPDYDCVLYKFTKEDWAGQLDKAGYLHAYPAK